MHHSAFKNWAIRHSNGAQRDTPGIQNGQKSHALF